MTRRNFNITVSLGVDVWDDADQERLVDVLRTAVYHIVLDNTDDGRDPEVYVGPAVFVNIPADTT